MENDGHAVWCHKQVPSGHHRTGCPLCVCACVGVYLQLTSVWRKCEWALSYFWNYLTNKQGDNFCLPKSCFRFLCSSILFQLHKDRIQKLSLHWKVYAQGQRKFHKTKCIKYSMVSSVELYGSDMVLLRNNCSLQLRDLAESAASAHSLVPGCSTVFRCD